MDDTPFSSNASWCDRVPEAARVVITAALEGVSPADGVEKMVFSSDDIPLRDCDEEERDDTLKESMEEVVGRMEVGEVELVLVNALPLVDLIVVVVNGDVWDKRLVIGTMV